MVAIADDFMDMDFIRKGQRSDPLFGLVLALV
jgi:hypothetical protein